MLQVCSGSVTMTWASGWGSVLGPCFPGRNGWLRVKNNTGNTVLQTWNKNLFSFSGEVLYLLEEQPNTQSWPQWWEDLDRLLSVRATASTGGEGKLTSPQSRSLWWSFSWELEHQVGSPFTCGEKHGKGSNPEKKAASFWTLSKRGVGVQPESKSFGVVFFGLSFGHFQ